MSTTPEMSNRTNERVRVSAVASFMPEQSDAEDRQYVFGYRIVIANEGKEAVQLVSRNWTIIDGDGKREEISGPGVVGQKPRIEPGDSFEYESRCPLKTSWGTMEGHYVMKRDDGRTFDAPVARFYLRQHAPARAERVGG